MKKLRLFFALLVVILSLNGCIVQKPYVSYDKNSAEPVRDKYEIYQAIRNYPLLKTYYDEGVIQVVPVKRVKATNSSSPEYIVKYRYCKHYITDYGEQMKVLRENFPEIYGMYCEGKIQLNEMYEYVDDKGGIKYHILYKQIYSGYHY